MNVALLFGGIVAGAVVIKYGVGNVKTAVGNNTPASSSTPATSSGSSSSTGSVTTELLSTIGAPFGWAGSELTDWEQVIHMESGGDPNAVNPTSGAFGIGQMLAPGGSPGNLAPNRAKYADYGGDASTVPGQLRGMAGYISQTYGSPSVALAHEQKYGWY